MARTIIIHTQNVCPPIPLRSMDWQATADGYEPGHPCGTGATEEEAVHDLVDQLFEEAN